MPKVPEAAPQAPPPPQVDPKFLAMAASTMPQLQAPASEVTKALDEAIRYRRERGEEDQAKLLERNRADWMKKNYPR